MFILFYYFVLVCEFVVVLLLEKHEVLFDYMRTPQWGANG